MEPWNLLDDIVVRVQPGAKPLITRVLQKVLERRVVLFPENNLLSTKKAKNHCPTDDRVLSGMFYWWECWTTTQNGYLMICQWLPMNIIFQQIIYMENTYLLSISLDYYEIYLLKQYFELLVNTLLIQYVIIYFHGPVHQTMTSRCILSWI